MLHLSSAHALQPRAIPSETNDLRKVDLRSFRADLGNTLICLNMMRPPCVQVLEPPAKGQDEEELMHQRKGSSIKSLAISGIAASILLGLAGATLAPSPAEAVVYCQYINYPVSCVARPGVVLAPRPVARAAVRATTASPTNLNGGVNRVGVRR